MRGKNLKKNLRQKNGITLIALVITIIVLLILAGVTIAMLTGNNGILSQAQNAQEQTEVSELIERVQVDIFGEQANMNGYISKEKMKDVLEEYFINVPGELPDSIADLELISKEEYGGYSIKGSKIFNGILSEKTEPGSTLAEKITSSNYGDYINYNVDLSIDGNQNGDTTDIDDWRIFYKDEDGNVFIIASDYVPTTNELLNEAINKIGIFQGVTGTYNIRWRVNDKKEIDSRITDLFKFGFDYTNSIDKGNMKLVSNLLNADIWNGFATGVEGATAIGGPTLEMYIASWNEKEYTKIYYDSMEYGYRIGLTEETKENSVSIKSDVNGYNDTLYYPHKSNYDNRCYGYWLASPVEAQNKEMIFGIDCTGEVTSAEISADFYAVRPLVCLPAETKGSLDEQGVWQLK